MSTTNVFIKDPQAVLDYKFDFKPLTHLVNGATSDYLATAETISAATVTAPTSPTGLVIDSYSITDTGTSVSAWISGGTVDTDYVVVCHIVTSASRTDDRSIVVQVRNR